MSASENTLPKGWQTRQGLLILLLAIVLLAAIMRTPLLAFGSLVPIIGHDLALNSTILGLIGTLPMIAFSLCSLVAAPLSRRWGIVGALLAMVALIVVGTIVRSLAAQVLWLFIGTILLSSGIAVVNVLLPVLIKYYLPRRASMMTGIYTATISLTGGTAAVAAVPLAKMWGWQIALAVWALPGMIACVLWAWLKWAQFGQKTAVSAEKGHGKRVWYSSLAWQISILMALQSLVFYTFASWLPSMLVAKGMSLGNAALHASVAQWVGIPTFSFMGWAMSRWPKHHGLMAFIATLCLLIGLMGLWQGSLSWMWLCVSLNNIGISCFFFLCLMFISLRTQNATDATHLSGMAQCVGYLLAGLGPWGTGILLQYTGSFGVVYLIFAALMLLGGYLGYLAARPIKL